MDVNCIMKKKIHRNIIFSKSQLKSKLRVGDYLQIYPCSFSGAPISFYCSDFPLVIEYIVDESPEVKLPDDLVELSPLLSPLTPQINQLNRLLRLLSVLTNYRFFSHQESEFKWGVALPSQEMSRSEKEEFRRKTSRIFLPVFNYPNISNDLLITEFSEPNFPDAVLVKHEEYYRRIPIDDRSIEIDFPTTIHQAVGEYFSIEKGAKSVVNSVNHLICNGLEIKNKMKSLSFLSFVSAIETLVSHEYKHQNKEVEFECSDCQTLKTSPFHCPKCQRPVWAISAKFKEFLKAYISSTQSSIKKYSKIYNLRSKIVHAGALLLGDEEIDWGDSEKANEQHITYYESMQIARECLANWLLKKSGKVST